MISATLIDLKKKIQEDRRVPENLSNSWLYLPSQVGLNHIFSNIFSKIFQRYRKVKSFSVKTSILTIKLSLYWPYHTTIHTSLFLYIHQLTVFLIHCKINYRLSTIPTPLYFSVHIFMVLFFRLNLYIVNAQSLRIPNAQCWHLLLDKFQQCVYLCNADP